MVIGNQKQTKLSEQSWYSSSYPRDYLDLCVWSFDPMSNKNLVFDEVRNMLAQECGNCEQQFLRNSSQLPDDICDTYKSMHMWRVWQHDTYDIWIHSLYHSWINIRYAIVMQLHIYFHIMIVDHRYDYYIACTFTNCIQHTCGRYKNLESILAASGSLALLSFLCENVLQNQNGVETSMEQGFQASHIQHKASFFWRFTWYVVGPGTLNEGYQDAVAVDILLPRCNNAAAAVQYLHSVSIAHRGIKPHNFCHQLHCHSWEVKLIDSMAFLSHECDSLTLMQRRNLRRTCWVCSTSILRLI